MFEAELTSAAGVSAESVVGPGDVLKNEYKWVDESVRYGGGAAGAAGAAGAGAGATVSASASVSATATATATATALAGPSETASSPGSSPELDSQLNSVRKRLEKRKFRPIEQALEVHKSDKKLRNTMAARRYRQRQRQDIELLDARIKQLELELVSAKLETRWWQMEAGRWESQAKNKKG